MPLTILVPRGAEEQAVRRAAPGATIVAIAAGAASGDLPAGVAPPAFVVLAGLCGSLTAARVGDVVVYTRVTGPREQIDIAPGDLAALEQALPRARAVAGWTSERVVTRARERADLAARSGAGAVDMEGLHVARTLRARGCRFAMVRVVSDDPLADLPPIEDALDPSGAIRPLALACAFARAPLAAVRFVRDVQTSLRILGSVGAAVAAMK